MMQPKKPSVFGKMTVHTEAGIDQICRDIERRQRAGEKPFDVEDHRKMREKIWNPEEYRRRRAEFEAKNRRGKKD